MQPSPRHLKATFFDGARQIANVDLEVTDGQTITVGNLKSAADVRLGSEVVSRNHLAIALDGEGEVVICDVGSSNGTFDGDVELKSNEWHRIHAGSRIFLGGEVRMVIETLSGTAGRSGSTSRVATSTANLADLLKAQDQVVIGRGRECNLTLDDPMVSRQHATIYKGRDGSLMIKDMGSANGIFVNGRRIQQPTKLAPDTRIFMG
uniref:FHA domain-containing protein n=1 Tax=Prosthecobacter sp. TaxID=1965333 RepID=UPI003784737B